MSAGAQPEASDQIHTDAQPFGTAASLATAIVAGSVLGLFCRRPKRQCRRASTLHFLP